MSGELPVPVSVAVAVAPQVQQDQQQQHPPQPLPLQHHPYPGQHHLNVPFTHQAELDFMAAMKLTRGTSCVLCQQRKVRCDKNKPCANCVKARVECRIVPPQPPRRRKKRLQEKDLVDRLRKYEALLSENGVKFDAIGHDLRVGSGSGAGGGGGGAPSERDSLEDVAELENDFEGLKTSPGSSARPSVDSGRRRSQAENKYAVHPL
jgi:hypothetical protein